MAVNALQSHCQPQFGAIVLWALKQIWEVSIVIVKEILLLNVSSQQYFIVRYIY